MSSPWFCLMGPTAAGKTDLACELVQYLPFEVISIDSVMIYQDMNIGSAKPSAAVLAGVPHHLINIITPEETYSVAKCCDDVRRCGQAIVARGNIPLLVGGTMMYFRALQQGLSPLPEADALLRQELMAEAQSLGWLHLHQRLAQCDPSAAQRIHPHDKQRIIRALEVFTLGQKPLSDCLDSPVQRDTIPYYNLILMPEDRASLHARIAERFLGMLATGLIEEVQDIIARWSLTSAHPAMRCVGYRQVWQYLYEHHDQRLLREQGIAATRQLAKRQLTWLRHWPQAHYFAQDDRSTLGEMIALIRQITHN